MKFSIQNSNFNCHNNGFQIKLDFWPKAATCTVPQQNEKREPENNALIQSKFNSTSLKSVDIQLNNVKYYLAIAS